MKNPPYMEPMAPKNENFWAPKKGKGSCNIPWINHSWIGKYTIVLLSCQSIGDPPKPLPQELRPDHKALLGDDGG